MTYLCPHCQFANHVLLEGRTLAASTRCHRCRAAFVLEDAERVAVAANDPNARSPRGLLHDVEPESHREPMPSKEQLAAPRVPTFDSSVSPIRRLGSSLAPGASVFAQRGPSPSRTVPLLFAILSSFLCLVIGGLLGVIFGDLLLAPAQVQEITTGGNASSSRSELATLAATGVVEAPSAVAPTFAPVEPQSTALEAPRRSRPKASGVTASAAPEAIEESGGLPDKLSSGHIQRTVHRNQPGVRHSCWNRALASRDPSSPSSARVSVRITIAPSGKVTEATAGEAAGYPGLGPCVASKVRSWTFPKAAGNTRAELPFTFATQ